ncbi:MAG: hypothetical protein WA139_06170 [Candidatus Aenigmatarchaeota archaeon]
METLDIFNNIQHEEEFKQWRIETEDTLIHVFEKDSIQYNRFDEVQFYSHVFPIEHYLKLETYKEGLAAARAVLKSAISQIENFGNPKNTKKNVVKSSSIKQNIEKTEGDVISPIITGITAKRDVILNVGKKESNKPYEKGSIIDLASIGFGIIKNLSKSQTITDKLIGFNGLIISFIISILLTTQLFPSAEFLTSIVALAVFFLFSLVGMIGYIPLLETLASLTENKITGLKFSIYLLFLALISSIIGISLNLVIVKYVAYFLLGSQLLIIPAGCILPKSNIENKEISFNGLWDVLGKVGIVLGIISGLITIISVIPKPF